MSQRLPPPPPQWSVQERGLEHLTPGQMDLVDACLDFPVPAVSSKMAALTCSSKPWEYRDRMPVRHKMRYAADPPGLVTEEADVDDATSDSGKPEYAGRPEGFANETLPCDRLLFAGGRQEGHCCVQPDVTYLQNVVNLIDAFIEPLPGRRADQEAGILAGGPRHPWRHPVAGPTWRRAKAFSEHCSSEFGMDWYVGIGRPPLELLLQGNSTSTLNKDALLLQWRREMFPGQNLQRLKMIILDAEYSRDFGQGNMLLDWAPRLASIKWQPEATGAVVVLPKCSDNLEDLDMDSNMDDTSQVRVDVTALPHYLRLCTRISARRAAPCSEQLLNEVWWTTVAAALRSSGSIRIAFEWVLPHRLYTLYVPAFALLVRQTFRSAGMQGARDATRNRPKHAVYFFKNEWNARRTVKFASLSIHNDHGTDQHRYRLIIESADIDDSSDYSDDHSDA